MRKIKELKCICKNKVAEIRAEKAKNYADPNWRGDRWTVQCLGQDYRRHHIAYCLLRGRTYEQIEPRVLDQNKISARDWERIEAIKTQFTEVENETLRVSAG